MGASHFVALIIAVLCLPATYLVYVAIVQAIENGCSNDKIAYVYGIGMILSAIDLLAIRVLFVG